MDEGPCQHSYFVQVWIVAIVNTSLCSKNIKPNLWPLCCNIELKHMHRKSFKTWTENRSDHRQNSYSGTCCVKSGCYCGAVHGLEPICERLRNHI